MTSQATLTKSPTLETLTDDQRVRLIEFIADRYLENIDGRDLAQFFFDSQCEYLKEYSDDELRGALEDITYETEYDEIIEELVNATV